MKRCHKVTKEFCSKDRDVIYKDVISCIKIEYGDLPIDDISSYLETEINLKEST